MVTTRTVSTSEERVIGIYEGERHLAEENTFLGELTRTVKKGTISNAEVLFEVNTDGILTVSYKDTKEDEVIQQEFGRCARVISREEIAALKEAAKVHKNDDLKEIDRLQARNALLTICVNIRYNIEKDENLLDKATRTNIVDNCETVMEWAQKNEKEDADVYNRRLEEVLLLWEESFKAKYTQPKIKGIFIIWFV